MFDNIDLNPEELEWLAARLENPKDFAETFLINPADGSKFQSNIVQDFIFTSNKLVNYVCAHRRSGKCVEGSSLVLHPETLIPTRIDQLEGITKTLTFDFTDNKVYWVPCSWVRSGCKHCRRISLIDGTSIIVSDDHRVFESKHGWIEAKDLEAGAKILVPNEIPVFGDLEITEERAEFLIDVALTTDELPEEVFRLNKPSLRLFVEKFWRATGRVLRNGALIVFTLRSTVLSDDLQHLLHRFGITSYKGEEGLVWLENEIDIRLFLNLVNTPTEILEVKSSRHWLHVKENIPVGWRDVYDMCVDHEDHNFLINDVVVHNSYGLVSYTIWYLVTHPNAEVVYFAPGTAQLESFINDFDNFLNNSPLLLSMKARYGNLKKPFIKRTFTNGATLELYIPTDKRRGISANMLIVDESQDITPEQWQVITPIMAGHAQVIGTVKVFIAGTLRNPFGKFYERVEKLGPDSVTGVLKLPVDKNPDWSDEMIEQIRLITSEEEFNIEWLLRVGIYTNSVFRLEDITRASQSDWAYGPQNSVAHRARFIGIDWDKSLDAGTNIVVGQYDPGTKNLQIIDRHEEERHQFTFSKAVEKAFSFCDKYKPELLICDKGQGEPQFEMLIDLSNKYPEVGMINRVRQLGFNQKIFTIDPVTFKEEQKPVKEFLVSQFQYKMQESQFQFPGSDMLLRNQLLNYRVVDRTPTKTKYIDTNEHLIDCILFILYGIYMLYEDNTGRYRIDNWEFRTVNAEDILKITGEESILPSIMGVRYSDDNSGIYRSPVGPPAGAMSYKEYMDHWRKT